MLRRNFSFMLGKFPSPYAASSSVFVSFALVSHLWIREAKKSFDCNSRT